MLRAPSRCTPDDPAFRFLLIHATNGAAGQIAEGSGATRETLGAVREEEDRRSWVALGREPDRHEWLGYPDGGVADEPFDGWSTGSRRSSSEERPDVVITFGPDGSHRPPDHITVGRAATAAFDRLADAGTTTGSPGCCTRRSGLPRSRRWNERLVADGKEPIDPTQLYQPRGVPDDTIGVDVDCAPRRRPQARGAARAPDPGGRRRRLHEDGMRDALARETHVIARPGGAGGGAPLADVFEGL